MSERKICRESFYYLLRYGRKSFDHTCEIHGDSGYCDIPDDTEIDYVCDAIEQFDQLTAELEQAKRTMADEIHLAKDDHKTICELQASNKAMRETLKPFVAAIGNVNIDLQDDENAVVVYWPKGKKHVQPFTTLHISDFKTARQALSGKGE